MRQTRRLFDARGPWYGSRSIKSSNGRHTAQSRIGRSRFIRSEFRNLMHATDSLKSFTKSSLKMAGG